MSDSNTQKVLKGVSSQTLVTIVLGVVEIVSFSIMSRLLSQEDFGYFAAITAITTVFSSFSETGIGSALIQRKEINKRFIDNAFTMSLVFGVFISLLMLSLSGVLAEAVVDSSLKVPIMLMSVTLLCHCLTSVNTSLLIRNLQFIKVGVVNLISLVITTIVAVVLALKGFGYYAILTKAVLSSVITLVLSRLFVSVRYGLALNKETVKSIFGFSGWLMASVFFRNFAQQVDRLMMGKLLSVEALGSYNRPKEFINQISTKLNGIFDTALFPVLSGIQDNKKSLQNAYLNSFYYLNIFAMLLSTLFLFNHELIIRVFLGEQWMNVKWIFVVLSLALIFNIDGRLSDCYFRSLGLTKQQFYFRILELVVKILFLIIGATWGVLGVAVSIVLANIVMILAKTLFIANKVEITPYRTFEIIVKSWRFVLFLTPVLIVSYLLLPHNWGGNIVLAFIYLVLCCVLFVLFPKSVGTQYYKDIYPKIRSYISKLLDI